VRTNSNSIKDEDKPSEITQEQLISAFQEELEHLNRRIYELECKIRKFEDIFEKVFRTELNRRTSKESNMGEKALAH
jgi:predicted  nucleic acid-binding Zn-ribbon protein